MRLAQSGGIAILLIGVCTALAESTWAAEPAEIDAAIERGVRRLKSLQAEDGSWPGYPLYQDGTTALAGLALSKSGLKRNDPALRKALDKARDSVDACQQTYSAALLMMFLDSAGGKEDQASIQRLASALASNQLQEGSWSYFFSSSPSLLGLGIQLPGDNSNTQFAALGMWVARRHEADVGDSLERCGKYFRESIQRTGDHEAGWGYQPGANPTVAMTCSGLIALATQHGNKTTLTGGRGAPPKRSGQGGDQSETSDLTKDEDVQAALRYLGRMLEQDASPTDCYTLWSLERVGVIYGLKKFGKVEWYPWGADALVKRQEGNGSWQGQYTATVDTSLSLLFLSRANVAADLTAIVAPGAPAEGERSVTSGTDQDALRTRADRAESNAGADALVDELLAAKKPRQMEIIQELRDAKGNAHSDALVRVIAATQGAVQEAAREALAARFGRMKPKTLAGKLKSDDPEVLVAAARAAAEREMKEVVGELIELLTHSNQRARTSAFGALKGITGEDFGPGSDSTAAQQFAAQKRWLKWHGEQP